MPTLDKALDVIIEDGNCLTCGQPAYRGADYCVSCATPEDMAPHLTGSPEVMAIAELAARELCRRRLLPFIQRLKPQYMAGWFHKDLAARLERFSKRVEAGESPCLILNTPPRHGKTEQASKGLVAWHLGRCPEHQIIAATHSDKLAIDNSRDVLDYVGDERYQALFPGTALKSDNKGASGWRTTKGGSYKPLGVGAGIAGYGAHILIIDDPHRDKDAYSEAVRDNIWRWYKSSARTRLMPGGGQLIIQTRWVLDDLTGRLVEEEGKIEDGGKWEVVCYPAIAEHDEYRTPSGLIVSLPGPGHKLLRRTGEALHPARYSIEALKEHQKDPVVWAALYQQNPTAGEAAVFKVDEIKTCLKADIPKRLSYYTTADLALSTSQRGDFCVLMHGGVDQDDNLWIVDVERGKWDSLEIAERLLDSWRTYRQAMIGVEKSHMEMALAPFIDKLASERGVPGFSYEALEHGNKDKLVRARPIQARMRQGKVIIPSDAPWSADLLKELAEFPVGRHDDMVDALAWLGQMLDTMMPAAAEQGIKNQPAWAKKLKGGRTQRTWKTA